jgi:hypothetical protein
MHGISVFGSSGCSFFCNTFDTLTTGMVFIGTNNLDSTWDNIFYTADTSICVGESMVLPGKLNDQSGNEFRTSGNEFHSVTGQHLVKLDTPFVNYFKGSDELFPPIHSFHFNVLDKSWPAFSCSNDMIQTDTVLQNAPTSCAEGSDEYNYLSGLIEEYAMEGMELINQHEDSLWSLANKCPVRCGDAIFIARALLMIKYEGIFFNDDSLCRVVPMDTAIADSGSYMLYPNPNVGALFIQHFLPESSGYELRFYDIMGRTALMVSLPGENHHSYIDVTSLSSGCYFVSLFHGSQRLRTDKLIICR